MKNSIKSDLKMWFLSGRILLLFLSIVVCCVFFQVTAFNIFREKNGFNNILETSFDESDLDSKVIDETRKIAETYLHAINPEHALTYCMEIGIYVFPFILSTFSALSVQADYHNKISRHRCSREGKLCYFLSKQISAIISVFLCVCAAILVSIVSSDIFYKVAQNENISPYIHVNGAGLSNVGNNVKNIAFFALCIFICMEVGFFLGTITKTAVIPMVTIIIIHYIAGTFFPYAPTLCASQIANTIFDGQGSIGWGRTQPMCSVGTLWLLLAGYAIFLEGASILIFRFRSAYK